MLTKVLWQALLVSPCFLGVTLVASISPSLAESDKTAESDLILATEVTTPLESQVIGESSTNPVTSATTILSQKQTSELHIEQLEQPQIAQSAEFVSSSPNFSVPITPSEQQSTLTLPTWTTDGEITPLQTSGLEVSQTTVSPDEPADMNTEFPSLNTEETPGESPNTNTEETPGESPNTNTEETPGESPNIEEPQTTVSDSNRWHFLLKPYLYLPFKIYGDTTFRGLGAGDGSGAGGGSGIEGVRDFFLDRNDIRTVIDNNLNFVFFGELEAWSPNYRLGSLVNVNYLSLSNDSTLTRPVRFPRLDNFIPTELQANVDVNVWSVDLAATYRFYNQSKVNPEGVSTEFDLGPLLFDVIGGLNISSVSADLNLSTNLGGQVSLDKSTTVVSPLLGGRLRLNVAPKLAVVITGSFSGFGIEGLTRWDAQAGIDWKFAGNTSLGVAYRFAYLNYSNSLDNLFRKDFGLKMNSNGPVISFSFRF